MQVADTEFLHDGVALRLAQFAMQRVGIISFLHQLVGNFLCFLAGAAENDAVYLRIIVNNAFQGSVFVFGMNGENHMLHVACAFILTPDSDFLCVVQVFFGDARYFGAHGSGEQKRVTFLRNVCKNSIDAVRKSHVQHFICLVHHYILDGGEGNGFALHEVEQASWSGHYDMHTAFQGTYLAFNGRTAIYGQYPQAVNVFGIVIQVTCNLQAEFAGRTKNK